MKVAEKDRVVHGMLEEEYRRCKDALQSLQDKIERYPKGTLNVRKKQHKGKEYSYHYLVSREGGKVVNRHVARESIPPLQDQLKSYKKRIAYLEGLLNTSKSRRVRIEDSSRHKPSR
jgi:hypothetical protein